jgi:hypothetical protein
MASSRIKTSFNPSNGIVTIRIEDANVYDAGAFKIAADNIGGRAESACVINVNKAPVIDARPVIDPEAFKYIEPQKKEPTRPVHRPSASYQPDQPVSAQELVAPNFIVGLPANFKLHEGEPIKLSCQVEGYPKPTVIFSFYY